jgi:hypothetical protein
MASFSCEIKIFDEKRTPIGRGRQYHFLLLILYHINIMAQKVIYYHVNIISKKVIYDSDHIIFPIFDYLRVSN